MKKHLVFNVIGKSLTKAFVKIFKREIMYLLLKYELENTLIVQF